MMECNKSAQPLGSLDVVIYRMVRKNTGCRKSDEADWNDDRGRLSNWKSKIGTLFLDLTIRFLFPYDGKISTIVEVTTDRDKTHASNSQ